MIARPRPSTTSDVPKTAFESTRILSAVSELPAADTGHIEATYTQRPRHFLEVRKGRPARRDI